MTPAKVLIADDEPLNLLLFAEMIKPMGHTVSLASDGLDAVQKMNEVRPDLIILDWNMPRLDGCPDFAGDNKSYILCRCHRHPF